MNKQNSSGVFVRTTQRVINTEGKSLILKLSPLV